MNRHRRRADRSRANAGSAAAALAIGVCGAMIVAVVAMVAYDTRWDELSSTTVGRPRARNVAAGGLARVATPEERRKADQNIAECRARPRYSFFTSSGALTRQPGAFCGSPDNATANCAWAQWGEGLVLLPAPAYIVAFLAFPVVCWVFWCGRCCCFGGCRTSRGLCCGSHSKWKAERDGYSSNGVLALKVLLVVVAALCIAFLVLGLVGNGLFTKSVVGFAGLLRDTARNVVALLNKVAAVMTAARQLDAGAFTGGFDVGSIARQADSFSKTVDIVYGVVKNVDKGRSALMYVNFFVPTLLVGLCCVAAFLGWPKLAWPLALSGFFWICVCWIMFGIHFPIGTLVADTCVFADFEMARDPRVSYLFDSLVSCSNQSVIAQVFVAANQGISFAYAAVCGAYGTLCNSTFPCDHDGNGVWDPRDSREFCMTANCPVGECNRTNMDRWTNTTKMMVDWYTGCADQTTGVMTGGCPYSTTNSVNPCPSSMVPVYCNVATARNLTLSECAGSCRDTVSRNLSSVISVHYRQLSLLSSLLLDDLPALLSCSAMKNLVNSARDFICVTLVNALDPITIAEGGFGGLIILATVLGILGIKRFNRDNLKSAARAKAAEGGEEGPQGEAIELAAPQIQALEPGGVRRFSWAPAAVEAEENNRMSMYVVSCQGGTPVMPPPGTDHSAAQPQKPAVAASAPEQWTQPRDSLGPGATSGPRFSISVVDCGFEPGNFSASSSPSPVPGADVQPLYRPPSPTAPALLYAPPSELPPPTYQSVMPAPGLPPSVYQYPALIMTTGAGEAQALGPFVDNPYSSMVTPNPPPVVPVVQHAAARVFVPPIDLTKLRVEVGGSHNAGHHQHNSAARSHSHRSAGHHSSHRSGHSHHDSHSHHGHHQDSKK